MWKISLKNLSKNLTKSLTRTTKQIGNDFLQYVKDKDRPKEPWTSLCNAFQRKGVSNRIFVRRKLLTLKMKDDEEQEAHILKFDKI